MHQEKIKELKIYGRGGSAGIEPIKQVINASLSSLRHLVICNDGKLDLTETEGHTLLKSLAEATEMRALERLDIANVPSWFKDSKQENIDLLRKIICN